MPLSLGWCEYNCYTCAAYDTTWVTSSNCNFCLDGVVELYGNCFASEFKFKYLSCTRCCGVRSCVCASPKTTTQSCTANHSVTSFKNDAVTYRSEKFQFYSVWTVVLALFYCEWCGSKFKFWFGCRKKGNQNRKNYSFSSLDITEHLLCFRLLSVSDENLYACDTHHLLVPVSNVHRK